VKYLSLDIASSSEREFDPLPPSAIQSEGSILFYKFDFHFHSASVFHNVMQVTDFCLRDNILRFLSFW
jgi:hypothetical protein